MNNLAKKPLKTIITGRSLIDDSFIIKIVEDYKTRILKFSAYDFLEFTNDYNLLSEKQKRLFDIMDNFEKAEFFFKWKAIKDE
jgi:hypothetical protein